MDIIDKIMFWHQQTNGKMSLISSSFVSKANKNIISVANQSFLPSIQGVQGALHVDVTWIWDTDYLHYGQH